VAEVAEGTEVAEETEVAEVTKVAEGTKVAEVSGTRVQWVNNLTTSLAMFS